MVIVNKKETIAVFDFDGTITKKDTFIDFSFRNLSFLKIFFCLIKNLPDLLLCFLRIKLCSDVKEKIFYGLFKNVSSNQFNELCYNYSIGIIPGIIREKALSKIKWHKESGHKLVIVSASIENWIMPWAKENGFEKVIATIPEVSQDKLTGKFKTKNCNNEEKAVRFLKEYPSKENYYLYVYGDSHKDKYLLSLANEKFYKFF